MTTDCPLPIDWLDFLEGDRNKALEDHLNGCASCQELVRRLEPVKGKSLSLGPYANALRATLAIEAKSAIRPGDIWRSAESFNGRYVQYSGLDRLLLLVLRSVDQAGGSQWFDVVPVFTDPENAISTDLNLVGTDTTLARPLRVDLALQTTIESSQVDGYLGSLTDVGHATVRRAVQGDIDTYRIGAVLEGEDDPRLVSRRQDASTVRTLSRPRSHLVEAGDLDGSDIAPRVLLLKVAGHRRAGHHLALAASARLSRQSFDVSLATPVPGIEITGELHHNPRTDAISLSVATAVGLKRNTRAIVHAGSHKAVTSPMFVPEGGREFELVSKGNVLLAEITGIELRIE